MLDVERQKLQDSYMAIIQEVNKVSPETARYYADRASEQQMLVHVQWYARQKAEATPGAAPQCPARNAK